MSSVTASLHSMYTNTRLAGVMNPWSCQPCMRRDRSTFLNHNIISLGLSSFSLKHLRHMNWLRHRKSSPVDAWTITRLGVMIDCWLGCFITESSCLPLWVWVGGSLWLGTVGTGTASGPSFRSRCDSFRSGNDCCDFLRFSLFKCSTGSLGVGFTFLVLFFFVEAATNRFHVRAGINTGCRLMLFSVFPLLECPPSVLTSTTPPFLDDGDMESTVPISPSSVKVSDFPNVGVPETGAGISLSAQTPVLSPIDNFIDHLINCGRGCG